MCLKTGTIQEHFAHLNCMLYELSVVLKLLSASFSPFLLASITAQFVMSLNSFYKIFLTTGGFVPASFSLVISMLFWILFPWGIVMLYIIGCGKFRKHMLCPVSIMNHLNTKEIKDFSNVRNFNHSSVK